MATEHQKETVEEVINTEIVKEEEKKPVSVKNEFSKSPNKTKDNTSFSKSANVIENKKNVMPKVLATSDRYITVNEYPEYMFLWNVDGKRGHNILNNDSRYISPAHAVCLSLVDIHEAVNNGFTVKWLHDKYIDSKWNYTSITKNNIDEFATFIKTELSLGRLKKADLTTGTSLYF